MISHTDEVRVVIFSSRFAESRKFYEKDLGLNIVKEWDHGCGELGVVYTVGGVLLEMLQSTSLPPNDSFYLYIKVEDVEELWRHLSGKIGLDKIEDLQTQPWGHRNFSIRDPNGYRLKFFSEL